MKLRIAVNSIVLLFLACTPAFAQEAPAEEQPLPEEDTILGQWYVQVAQGEVIPEEKKMRMIFNEDGSVFTYEGDRQKGNMRYTHTEALAEVKVYADNDPSDIKAIMKYSFLDDMMLMKVVEDPGQGREKDEFSIELTRTAKGTKRHQEMRDALFEGNDKMGRRAVALQMVRMRELYMGIQAYRADHDTMPDSLGDVLAQGYAKPDAALPASAKEKLPEDFDKWKKPKQRDWFNQHVGCIYIKTDPKAKQPSITTTLIGFPLDNVKDMITLVFADGTGRLLDQKEANQLIEKQTGATIGAWLQSKSPGSGQAPPKDQEKE